MKSRKTRKILGEMEAMRDEAALSRDRCRRMIDELEVIAESKDQIVKGLTMAIDGCEVLL